MTVFQMTLEVPVLRLALIK